MELYLIIGVWLLCAIAALLLAQSRGAFNPSSWFVVGLLTGPIGVLAALAFAGPPDPSARTCVHCGAPVSASRKRLCEHCGQPFAA